MAVISTIEELEALYGAPSDASIRKQTDRLTSTYRDLLLASPFFAFATVSPDGLDCSPRGDKGSAVRIVDDVTLAIPDWKGNNRLDSLRNLVADPRVALLFLIPGHDVTLRINGAATITTDSDIVDSFAVDGARPRSVVVVDIEAVYFQCARALMRSQIWSSASHVDAATLPTSGQILEDVTSGGLRAAEYDPSLYARLSADLF